MVTATFKSVLVSAALGTGTLEINPFAGAGEPRVVAGILPIHGLARVCVFLAECSSSIDLELAETLAGVVTRGIGVGGVITAGGFGAVRLSLHNQPWTLGVASLSIPTASGKLLVQGTGHQHGPFSIRGTTRNCWDADGDGQNESCGELQLVAPMQVVGQGFAPSAVAELTIRFVPEPSLALLLGTGVAVVAVVGARRPVRDGRK